MKPKAIIIIIFLLTCGAAIIYYIASLPPNPERLLKSPELAFLREDAEALAKAKIEAEQKKIEFATKQIEDKIQYIGFWRLPFVIGFFGVVGSLCFGGILYCLFLGVGKVREKSVVAQKIGESTIQVHYRLVKQEDFGRYIGGVIMVEGTRAQQPERAADMAFQMIRSFPRYASQVRPMLPEADLNETNESMYTPTFAELLHSGEIAPGHQMILGYEQGHPRYGSFQDIYSAAVAGESGSGKTSTMLHLIGNGVVSQGIHFWEMDLHFPHPESLGKKTEPLWQAKLMRFASTQEEILRMCQEIQSEISRRMVHGATGPELVLVIDELAGLIETTTIKPVLIATMKMISTTGRKCGVYMLAASQTWLASLFGNSIPRDTLTCSYVHRIKPRQAQVLIQNKEEVHKLKQVKKNGEVLLIPVADEGHICQMPYTTTRDMEEVTKLVINGETLQQVTVSSHPVTPPVTGVSRVTRLRETLSRHLKKREITLSQLAEELEINKGLLSRLINEGNASENTLDILETFFKSHQNNVIQFPIQEST